MSGQTLLRVNDKNCEASHCSFKERTLQIGSKISCITHTSNIIHIFHSRCYALTMCDDDNFLKYGKFSFCPICNLKDEIHIDKSYQTEIANTAFIYHVHNQNWSSVAKLIRSGLISSELQKRILQQKPELAHIMEDSTFAVEQRSATTDRSVRSRPIKATATSIPNPISSFLRRLIKQNLSQNRSCTIDELKFHIAAATGKIYSLSTINKIVNEVKQELKIT